MRAVAPRFIACPSDLQDARIVVYGIPFEGRVNLRKGACGGPRDLRLASDSIETYSPALGRDLEDLPLADVGDCELPDGAPPREQLDAARAEIAAWWRPGLIPFMLGGGHTATVPVMEAIPPASPDPRGHPLYVTIDVDVLDPSEAPGTGSPEPGGLRVPELIEIVRMLGECRTIGGDLVEVAHAWDPTGRTGIAAAWVIREAMLTWWGDLR